MTPDEGSWCSSPAHLFAEWHVLSTPPAFVLSQDQTLHKKTRKKNPSTQKEKTRKIIKPNQSENQKK
ncbi:hypothetical protein [Brevibacterium paucivorans]